MSRRYWFFFFVVSGFCSLLYEVVWLRLAMASYGVTTPLVSIVLSIFMGGLAIGSWGAGALMNRLADRPQAIGLRLYGAAEAATAISAVVVPFLLKWGREVLVGRMGGTWGSGSYYAASAAFVLVALLPFCLCMGATFPIALFVLRRTAAPGAAQSFSYLYVANVVGATLGTLTTAFVLVEMLGFSGTLAMAATANAILGAAALALSLRPDAARETPTAARSASPAAEPGASASATFLAPVPVLSALFVTGLVSMGMEVVWIRLLTPYLGNLVYCFASILALYLVATVAGSSLYRGWVRRRAAASPAAVPPWAWGAIAVASLLPLPAADPRVDLGPLLDSTYRIFGPGLIRAALAIVPFATALGFVTPLLMDGWSGGDPKRAGSAYGFNIVGCILGPLVSGFALLPSLGERGALVALSLPLLAGTLLAPTRGSAPGTRGRKGPWALATGLATAALVLLVSRGYEAAYEGGAVIRRDSTATVAAVGRDMDRQLLVNGLGMTRLTPITKIMAHLPLAFREKPPHSALIICFGMGTSYRSAMSWGIEATAVELIPSVPPLFGYFHADGEALLRSPRGHVTIDDGRRFLERSSELFDAIVVDPPPPVEAAGSSLLYSREFYAAARRRLSADGILQQWVPYGEPLVASAFMKAVLASFPYVRTFGSIEDWGVHILASARPIATATAGELAARLPPDAARDLVEWGPQATPADQFAGVLRHEFAPAQIVALYPGAPPLVDDRPLNEYFFVRRQLATWRAARAERR